MKSSSLLYISLCTPFTHTCFLRCELYGYMNNLWHDSSRLSNIHDRGELYELLNSIIYTYIHVCQVWAILYSLSTHVFRGWAIWATDELACDMFDVCKTTTQTEVKGLHCLRFIIDWVKAFGCQSDHRSASRSRRPLFPDNRCLWTGFCFGQYLMFSCSLGITHYA